MRHRHHMPRCRLQCRQPGDHPFSHLAHRLATVGRRSRVGEPGLQPLRFGFLQVIDALTAPAPDIAIAQCLDHLSVAAEQFGGLPGTQFRAAQQPWSIFELSTTGTPRRLPIHLQRFIRRKPRQFLCDGSSVAYQGQTGRLHEGLLCRWKVRDGDLPVVAQLCRKKGCRRGISSDNKSRLRSVYRQCPTRLAVIPVAIGVQAFRSIFGVEKPQQN